MFRSSLAALAISIVASPLFAAPMDDLIDALGVPELIEIMRQEGIDYGDEMSADMFASGPDERWEQRLDQIYDKDNMTAVMRAGFEDTLEGTDLEPLLAFFQSDFGAQVVKLELEARRAMVSEEIEDAARAAYREVRGEDNAHLTLVTGFIEANDLVEANVAGALNASFKFYRGLVDGGALEMGDADILQDVWQQEEETRADTSEWLNAFLMLAYGPLEPEQIADYLALSSTPEGKTMNRALFAGFNNMYDDISYALGLAAAEQMSGQDL